VSEKVQFVAEFAGAPINRDGVIKLKLTAPNSETGAVAKLLLKWGKEVKVSLESKKRSTERLVFRLLSITFRADETSQLVLEAEAKAIPVNDVVYYRNKAISVTVE
jgi:hypothetical protein